MGTSLHTFPALFLVTFVRYIWIGWTMNGVINKRSGSMYCRGLCNPAQVVGNRSIREEVETGKIILRFLIWLIKRIKEGGNIRLYCQCHAFSCPKNIHFTIFRTIVAPVFYPQLV